MSKNNNTCLKEIKRTNSSFSMDAQDTLLLHHERETSQKDLKNKTLKGLERVLSEIYDKSQHQPHYILVSILLNTQQLLRTLATMPFVATNFEGDFPTSSFCVEKELAKCISECLGDFHEQSKNIQKVLYHVQSYKAVQFHQQKNHSVSLMQVHSILEDNFQGSSLQRLIELIVKDSKKENRVTKLVTF